MFLKRIHKLFSFTSLIKLLIALALILQLMIISQMYFFSPDLFKDPVQLSIRLFRGVLFSFLAGWILAYPSLFLIKFLNLRMPWRKYTIGRFALQFPFAIVAGLLITPVILFPASIIFHLELDFDTIINNAYYMAILSLFLMIILEAWIHFRESINAKNRLLELEKKYNNETASQLQESREQLHSLLSHLMGAAYRCRFDEYYTIEYISDQIQDITGHPASDFAGNAVRSFASIVYPDDLELIRKIIEDTAQTQGYYEMEYRLIHRDGRIVWVSENGKCIFDDEGNVSFLDGIIMDISRRKEAELAVKEGERNYKDLMDFLPQPVFELNLEGKIMFSNRAGDDFFGKVPDDPNNLASALDHFIPEDIPRIIEKWKISSEGMPTEPGEFTAIKKDGSHCPVMIFGNPIYRHGKIVGRRGIIIDISERKKYELGLLKAKNELEQINNNLEQMVAERSKELMETNNQLLKVQKENLQSQFEILRQQINPHFLFNSLNVLSGLIGKDVKQAQLFIDEFSHIYRYVLETLEQPVSTLSKELDFMRSYMYLQQMRHGENLTWTVNIPANLLEMVLPPLSLQVVLENALKHNIVNEAKPLLIEIFAREKSLIVKNRLQPKISKGVSTGLGLKNLMKRYGLISSLSPGFTIENNHYIATLPLINIENDERTDR